MKFEVIKIDIAEYLELGCIEYREIMQEFAQAILRIWNLPLKPNTRLIGFFHPASCCGYTFNRPLTIPRSEHYAWLLGVNL